jgi:hypothetical protein
MDHAEFRRLLGADPARTSAEIEAHRASCPECAKYADDMRTLDRLLAGALAVPGPKAMPPPWAQRRSPVRWYALAASLFIAAVLGLTIWTGARRDALIVEVITHADRERNVLVESPKRVSDDKVKDALAKAGARLAADMAISVARVCKIRGNVAPHLILQTRSGAVAVLLLSHERVWLPHSFEKLGYKGRIVPIGKHSIAIVGTSEAAVEEGAELAGSSIVWPE